jgi:hypothetical protein
MLHGRSMPRGVGSTPYGCGMSELLPEQTADDSDAGWGDPHDDANDDDRRLRDERPPHHLEPD